ncbi:MAG: metalloprotease [Gelidibacter sp.]|nr:metalloprotease [Gelidibacter sp.]
MKLRFLITILSVTVNGLMYGQNSIELNAKFDMSQKLVKFEQHIRFQNTSKDTLKVIYLNDWINSFSTKSTPLAKRIAEEFNTKFHFAKSNERGFTVITSLTNIENESMAYTRIKDQIDVIEVTLNKPLLPQEFYDIKLTYTSMIPDATFTDYGVTEEGNYNLKHWYITPAVYDGEWHYYSNKNLDDLYTPKADVLLHIEFPVNYAVFSELDRVSVTQGANTQIFSLYGKDRIDTKLFLNKYPRFRLTQTDNFAILSDIEEISIKPAENAIINDKIVRFITDNLGEYPHKTLMITDIEYKKDPLYGLNQLPDFIRPFPNNLQYELKILKTALNNYLNNTLLLNPRTDYWLKDGIQVYYLMKYVEENYPDMKLLGSLARVWGIRSFHAADLNFNEQYNLFYMQMARTNRDQPLTMAKDSLIKFNANIAGKYKAGIGLKYLDDFINGDVLETTIRQYLDNKKLESTTSADFEALLKQNTTKNIDWFFTDYLQTRKKIDFKIKDVTKTNDSITLTIKNKRNNSMPVSLFTMNNDSIVSKTWIENVTDSKTLTIAREDANKLVLNYDNSIPEYNLRDNWKSLKGFFFNNKPLQFRLLKDVEDPNYSQVFFMPIVEFNNIYDGVLLGMKMYNKTLLRKNLSYKISPQYATKSKTLTGGTSIIYQHNIENQDLYSIRYGIGFGYSSFAENAFVTKITPSLAFDFRNDKDFRSNESSALHLRYVDISRTIKDNPLIVIDDPDYKVFNIRYVNSDSGLINFNSWFTDFQLSKQFGKIAFNYEYRKLSETNRQFNFRFFAGTFLYNKTDASSDYFSFALDRPTDYLFDYNYLGRSEATGIFSQQIIIAEGGFKSKLNTPFANQWIATTNMSTTLWKYIEVYGDLGLVKNKYNTAKVVYDSGIRLDLVTDYFELYFPIYSNLGWEIGQPHYDQKIRIKFTVDPQALFGLFRRKWY